MRKIFKQKVPLTALCGMIALSGCAGFSSKFQESHGVNYAPFADQTVNLFSSLNYELSPNELFLLRPYTDMQSPELKHVQSSVQLERVFLKGIMAYSTEIVNLSESGWSQTEQVKAYAKYVAELTNALSANDNVQMSITKEKLDGIVAATGEKKTLLEAMQAVRPIVLEFNQVNLRLIRDIAETRTIFVKQIHAKIDEKFSSFLELDQALLTEKALVSHQLSLAKEESAEAKQLSDRLAVIKKRQELIAPELDRYRELKLKMDAMAEQHDQMIRAGGRAVLLWSQAHQSMANGVTNPAEWFGMSDLKSTLTGTAKKAIP